ncbi:type 2 periplasmic-binding domain-containing protein [Nakamurella leprariae]|uniref:Transporter substrate-binding domain-containing protein n=1 Tax=Nakamurella leprariae TaxID=2803911 RepID=A0A938YJA6_9ACTN|nr:transporter substrate-binding domain-containing protein [Nakamurella leprariae]MBM9469184.1 transporter substrate-binding domain-containing protein [Nakamurella leprariae]
MTDQRTRRRAVLLTAGMLTLLLSGCGRPADPAVAPTPPAPTASSPTASSPTASSPTVSTAATVASTAAPLRECTAAALPTRIAGVLTVATGASREAPWVLGDPADGQGLDVELVDRLAASLGWTADQVSWITASTSDVDAFDVLVDRHTAAEVQAAGLEPSSGYAADADVVLVAAASGAGAGGLTAADLADQRLGAVAGAASVTDPQAVDTPGAVAVRYGSVEQAAVGIGAGEVDAVLVPLAQAFDPSVAAVGLTVAGRLPAGQWQPEQLVLALPPDSPLTACVSATLDKFRIEGTLDELVAIWIDPVAPELS